MKTPNSINSLISYWPTIGDFAKEIGCEYEAARQMKLRNRIASRHWPNVVKASEANGISGVTYEWLTETHASKYASRSEA